MSKYLSTPNFLANRLISLRDSLSARTKRTVDVTKNNSFIKIVKKIYLRINRRIKFLGKNFLVWFISLALIVGAQSTLIWAPKVGVYINAIALAGLCALAIVIERSRKVAISMAIIPLANVVTAAFAPRTIMGSTVILYTSILLVALVYRYMFTIDFPAIKTQLLAKGYGFGIPLMVVIGQFIGVAGYLFLRHHYPYRGYPLALVALESVVFAFTEEILLRGLIQQQGELIFRPIMAALATTVLYVFLVIDHGTMLALPVSILMGGILSFTYYKKKNLLLTFTINAAAKLTYIGLVASFVLRK